MRQYHPVTNLKKNWQYKIILKVLIIKNNHFPPGLHALYNTKGYARNGITHKCNSLLPTTLYNFKSAKGYARNGITHKCNSLLPTTPHNFKSSEVMSQCDTICGHIL
jgi:hypothetical protein